MSETIPFTAPITVTRPLAVGQTVAASMTRPDLSLTFSIALIDPNTGQPGDPRIGKGNLVQPNIDVAGSYVLAVTITPGAGKIEIG